MKKFLFLALLSSLAWGQSTLSSISGNNTSACTTQAYCTAPFVALKTASGNTGAQTVTVDPVPGNVSTLDIHNLLPAGTKVIAHSTDWFTSPGTGDHTQTKYTSNDANTVAAQDADMIQRHFDGRVIDWYSQFNTGIDGATQKIKTDLNGRCTAPQNCPLEFAIVEDQGAVTRTQGSRTGCATTDATCIQTSLTQDLCYMNGQYFGQNSYWKMNPTTHLWATSTNPVVLFFPPGDTSGWNTALSAIKAFVTTNGWAATHCPTGQQGANGGLVLIDIDTTNVTQASYTGGGSWISPSSWSATNQFLIDGSAGNYHESLYTSCNGSTSSACVGSAKKGFDDNNASWGTNRVVAQECGKTWMTILGKANSTFTGSNLTLQLATWNDYEEGSEIETGINSCYGVGIPTLNGPLLSWTATTTDTTYAPLTAGHPTGTQVDHWKVWYVDNSGNAFVAKDNIPLATTSLDLTTTPIPVGTWKMYVQLVGAPDVLNSISTNPPTYTILPPVAFNGTCTFRAIVSSGLTGPDVGRTSPVGKCVMPLADADGISPTLSTLTLDCARDALNNCKTDGSTFLPNNALSQFKCMSTWADGNCQLAIIRTLFSVPYVANTPVSLVVKLTGGPVTPSPSLAVDSSPSTPHSGTITVSTGSATFVIQKANFDLFHKVTVGTKVVSDSTVTPNEGLVVLGPSNANGTNAVPAAPAAPGFSFVACSGVNCPASSRTYWASVSYTSANGESPDSALTAQITVPATNLLQVSSPPSSTNATGYRVYICTGTGTVNCHLQNAFLPQVIGSAWTEPQNCQLSLTDGTTLAIAQSNCNRSSTITGGGILNYTIAPPTFPVMGNDGCFLKNGDGTTGCNTKYSTANDTNSTAVIEENGPAEAIIRANASFASASTSCPAAGALTTGNGTPNCYLHVTVRMYFQVGTKVRVVTSLQNADLAPCSGTGCTQTNANTGFAASDYKGLRDYYASVNLAGAGVATGTKSYGFQGDAAVINGALDGANDAFLYQGFSCEYLRNEGEGNLYQPGSFTAYVPQIFGYGPNNNFCGLAPNQTVNTPANNYVQDGYEIAANGALRASNNRNANETQMGWGDVYDSTGAGIEAGLAYIGAQWPKAVRLHVTGAGNYAMQVKLLPDQTAVLSTSTILPGGAQPYYVPWPAYQIDESFWDFHSACLGGGAPSGTPAVCPSSGQSSDFLAYQAPLLGTPANMSDWNRSKFFTELYPLIDGTTFDSYMSGTCANALGTVCPFGGASISGWSMTPIVPQVMKYWAWPNSGEGNQNELGWENAYKWLERPGFASSYLWAQGYYRHLAALALPRADFAGGWRGQCSGTLCPNLDQIGFPQTPTGGRAGSGKYPNGNSTGASRDWDNDSEHMHYFEIGHWGLLTDDQTIIDAANQAWNDTQSNPNLNKVAGCGGSGTCYFFARSKGQKLSHAARLYTYLNGQAFIQTGQTCTVNPAQPLCTDAQNALSVATTVMNHEIPLTGSGFGYGVDLPGTTQVSGVAPPSPTIEGQNPIEGMDYQGVNNEADPDSLNTCPVEGPTTCNGHKTSQWFFQDMEIEGLLDAVEAFGPSWVNYTLAIDEAYGFGRAFYSYGWWEKNNTATSCWSGGVSVNCSGGTASLACYPGNPCDGITEILRTEFYNADKNEFLFHPVTNSQWMNFLSPLLLSGQPAATYTDFQQQSHSARPSFNNYIQMRGTSGAETGSPEENAVVGLFLAQGTNQQTQFTYGKVTGATTPVGFWQDVTLTVNGVSGGSCTGSSCVITWTAPVNTIGYRMKTFTNPSTAKSILDWVLLDIATDPHNATHNFSSPITGAAAEINPDLVTPTFCTQQGYFVDGSGNKCWYGAWITDPRSNWPWFSSTEVPVVGTSTSLTWNGATDATSNIPGYTPANVNTFALKAFISTAAPPPVPPPAFGHSTKVQ